MDPRIAALDDTTAKRLSDLAQERASYDDQTQLAIAFAEAVESGLDRGDQQRAIVGEALELGLLSAEDLTE